MKKFFIIALVILIFLTSSCDFVKDRFLDGEPLYGGGNKKGTDYTPSPEPTESPVD